MATEELNKRMVCKVALIAVVEFITYAEVMAQSKQSMGSVIICELCRFGPTSQLASRSSHDQSTHKPQNQAVDVGGLHVT